MACSAWICCNLCVSQGSLCGTDVDECGSNPCLSPARGSCVGNSSVPTKTFVCTCKTGWRSVKPAATPTQYTQAQIRAHSDAAKLAQAIQLNASNPTSQTKQTAVDAQQNASASAAMLANITKKFATGIDCTVDVDECASAPCKNGATCKDSCQGGSTLRPNCSLDSSISIGSFVCKCVTGWQGTLCDVDTDECNAAPCKNGGTCAESTDCNSNQQNCSITNVSSQLYLPVGTHNCTCVKGYSGKSCEYDFNECASKPCSTKSSHRLTTCTESGEFAKSDPLKQKQLLDSYTCKCVLGYSGTHCNVSTVKLCANNNPCRNGARCDNWLTLIENSTAVIGKAENYSCSCQKGFVSRNCTVDIDECASSPCLNKYNNNTKCAGRCTSVVASATAARLAAAELGLLYNHTNFESSSHKTKGFYAYASGPNKGKAYFGTGGNSPQNTSSVTLPLYRPCPGNVDEFKCSCSLGYSGERCQTENDECASMPCKNGAGCVDWKPSAFCADDTTGLFSANVLSLDKKRKIVNCTQAKAEKLCDQGSNTVIGKTMRVHCGQTCELCDSKLPIGTPARSGRGTNLTVRAPHPACVHAQLSRTFAPRRDVQLQLRLRLCWQRLQQEDRRVPD